VSNNGLISFDSPIPDYTGELFPLGQEVIAPFYADIDTRSTGEVFYRWESPEQSHDMNIWIGNLKVKQTASLVISQTEAKYPGIVIITYIAS